MGISDWFTGEKPSLKFKQSPEQKNMWNLMFPIFENFMQGNFPQMYDLPSPVGPTQGWFDNISSEVKQSLWEPAIDAGNQMMEVMGSKGMMGGASTPASGSGATAMGRLFSDFGQGIGQQAWNMMSPGLFQDYSAQLGRNMQGYQTSLMPFQTASNMLPGTYSTPIVNPGSPGVMQSLLPMAGMFGASFLPWGNFGGGNIPGNIFGGQHNTDYQLMPT